VNAVTLADSFKRNEWIRFLKASPPEYRVRCLVAVLRCDGAAMLAQCLEALGWARSLDMITEVEKGE
jgi:hypothetical protein